MPNKKALSFVAVMIIVSLVALFLRFAVEQLIRINIAQNQANAQDTLKLISTAIENYARDHHGVFPASLSDLIKTNPPYIEKEYINLYYTKGYNYNCTRLEPAGYNCSALPAKCNFSGTKVYTVSAGGVLVSEECAKKE
jgi:type II secretory pathway pseudopilin PulG